MRTPLPQSLERKILVMNRHCCCICQKDGIGKEIWIHHIDGDNSNNVLNNLAVLCVTPHASQADAGLIPGKVGSGKKLTPDEVKEYKKIWERKIYEETKIKKEYLSIQKRKELETLYAYDINKIKNEILSFEGRGSLIKEKFDFLDQLVIEDFISGIKIRKLLIKAYSDMSMQLIGEVEKTKRLAKSIWGLFIHLVGPKYVKINREDLVLFRKGIDAIETLGSFAAEFNTEKISLKEVCSIIYDLGEIAHWYRLNNEKDKILKVLVELKKSANKFEKKVKNISKDRSNRIDIINKTIIKIKEKYKTNENAQNFD